MKSPRPRAAALADIEAGASISATARKFAVKAQTLALWCRAERANGKDHGTAPASITTDAVAPTAPAIAPDRPERTTAYPARELPSAPPQAAKGGIHLASVGATVRP